MITAPRDMESPETRPRSVRAARPTLLVAGITILAVVSGLVAYTTKTKISEAASGSEARAAAQQKKTVRPAESNRKSVEGHSDVTPPSPTTVDSKGDTEKNDPIPPGGPKLAWQPVASPGATNASTLGTVDDSRGSNFDTLEEEEQKARSSPIIVVPETGLGQQQQAKSGVDMPSSTPTPRSDITRDSSLASVVPSLLSDPALQALRSNPTRDTREGQESTRRFAEDNSTAAVTRVAGHSVYAIQPDSPIPAELMEDTTSQLPGSISAIVRKNVMNSLCGQTNADGEKMPCYIEIPPGSRFVGQYNSDTQYAQNRLQIVWTQLIFPDGTYADLGKAIGYDPAGGSGVKGSRDEHWKRVLAGALLTSVVSVGVTVSQNRSNTPLTYPSSGQVAGAAVGQTLGELGAEVTRKNLAIPPELKVFFGQPIEIKASKWLDFQAPYRAR